MRIGDMHMQILGTKPGQGSLRRTFARRITLQRLGRMDAEEQVRAFLESMDPKQAPTNVKGDVNHYKRLVGASTIISHLLPTRLKEPEKMLDAMSRAYSKRGFCIFPKEPVLSAFSKVGSETEKEGKLDPEKVFSHPNQFIVWAFIRSMKKPQILKYSNKLAQIARECDGVLQTDAIGALGRHPKAAENHAKELLRLAEYSGDEVGDAVYEALGNHPMLVQRYENEIASNVGRRGGESALCALGNHPQHKYINEIIRGLRSSRRGGKSRVVGVFMKHPELVGEYEAEILKGLNMQRSARSSASALLANPDVAEKHSADIINLFMRGFVAEDDIIDAVRKNPRIVSKNIAAVKEFGKMRNGYKRRASLLLLGAHPEIRGENWSTITKGLGDEDAEVRLTALDIIGKDRDYVDENSDVLAGLLKKPKAELRRAGLRALSKSPSAVMKHSKDIYGLLQPEEEPRVREVAAYALGQNPRLIKKILRKDPEKLARLEIVDLSHLVRSLEDSKKRRGMRRASREALRGLRRDIFKVRLEE